MSGNELSDGMLAAAFVTAYLALPLLTLGLLRVAHLRLSRFSFPSLFLLSYFVVAYMGIPALYFGLDPDRTWLGIVDPKVCFKLLMFSGAGMLVVASGFVYASRVLGLRADVVGGREFQSANGTQRRFVLALATVCTVVFIVYLLQVERIALLEAWTGSQLSTRVARSGMGNAFAGKYWRYHLFFREVLDYCVVFFFAELLLRRRRWSGVAFGAIFVVAAFSALASTEKAPLIQVLARLYLAYVIVRARGAYWTSVAKYTVAGITALVLTIYVFILGYSDLFAAARSVASRVLSGQIAPAYFYVDVFPTHRDYLMGESFPNMGGLLPSAGFPLTQFIADRMWPDQRALGIVGTAPTVFWGEAYANFGPVGVFVSCFAVGLGLYAVPHVLTTKLPMSPSLIAGLVCLAMHYRTLAETGFSTYLFDATAFAILAATVACSALGRQAQRPVDSGSAEGRVSKR